MVTTHKLVASAPVDLVDVMCTKFLEMIPWRFYRAHVIALSDDGYPDLVELLGLTNAHGETVEGFVVSVISRPAGVSIIPVSSVEALN